MGKKYSAQIFKRKQQHTQNYIDWIRNVISVQPVARILVTAIPDPWDIFEFFVNAYKCLHKTLVIEKESENKYFHSDLWLQKSF